MGAERKLKAAQVREEIERLTERISTLEDELILARDRLAWWESYPGQAAPRGR